MFAVVWRTVMLDRLADLYVAVMPEERAGMAAGVEPLNARLAANPLDVGESRSGGLRITFPPHLAVSFVVNGANRAVYATGLRRYGW